MGKGFEYNFPGEIILTVNKSSKKSHHHQLSLNRNKNCYKTLLHTYWGCHSNGDMTLVLMYRSLNSLLVRIPNGTCSLKSSLAVPQKWILKVKHRVTLPSISSTCGYSFRKMKYIYPLKTLYMNVHRSMLSVSTISTDRHSTAYPLNGMPCIHKKRWALDTCYNMDDPWARWDKWTKPDREDCSMFRFDERLNTG